jgi:hypothetical protein
MRTRDDIAVAFFKTINADATIQNVSHLNGTNKISKSIARNPNISNPFLTIDVIPETVLDNAEVIIALVRLRLSIDNNLQSFETDHTKAAAIETRLTTLLHEKQLTGNTGVTYAQCLRTGPARALFFPEAPNETMFLNDFRVWVI